MMKVLAQRILLALAMTATVMTFVGCGKKDSGSNNATNTQCLQTPYQSGCDGSAYNNYNGYGYQAYPYGYSSDPYSIYRYQYNAYYSNYYGGGNYQLCSCPQGSRPVYNGNMGTGCLAQNSIPRYAPVYYWSWSANSTYNNHYVNFNQMSNINGSVSNGGCYNNVAWSCMVGQSNQCPAGSTCKATASNAPIGICIKQ